MHCGFTLKVKVIEQINANIFQKQYYDAEIRRKLLKLQMKIAIDRLLKSLGWYKQCTLSVSPA